MKPKKLKRVPLKEELVALTKDYKLAIVLQQMIYWNERCSDFDKFIEEENSRRKKNKDEPELEHTNGWVYKKAEQLSEETLMNVSAKQIIRYLKKLEENGWIESRNNPKYKWDRTLQYRLNLIKLMADLNAIGYQLEGYAIFKQKENDIPPKKEPDNIPEKDIPKCPPERTRCPIEETQNEIQKGQDVGAIPEITLESTPETTSAKQKENSDTEQNTPKQKTNANQMPNPKTDSKQITDAKQNADSLSNTNSNAEHSRISFFLKYIENAKYKTNANINAEELMAKLKSKNFVAGQLESEILDNMSDAEFGAFYGQLLDKDATALHTKYWDRFTNLSEQAGPPEINRMLLRKKHPVHLKDECYYEFLDFRKEGFGGYADIVEEYVQHEMKLWDFKKQYMTKDAAIMKFQKEIYTIHPVAKHFLSLTKDQRAREMDHCS